MEYRQEKVITFGDKMYVSNYGKEVVLGVKPGEWHLYHVESDDEVGIFAVHSSQLGKVTPDDCVKHIRGNEVFAEASLGIFNKRLPEDCWNGQYNYDYGEGCDFGLSAGVGDVGCTVYTHGESWYDAYDAVLVKGYKF